MRHTRTGLDSRRSGENGFALLDALVALALLGLAAAGAAGLAHHAARAFVEAERLDAARDAARGTLVTLGRTPWIALPHAFGAARDDAAARLDTADGSLIGPEADAMLALPDGRLTVRLEGLGPAGVSAPFREALVLRVQAEASWAIGGGQRRRVTLDDWRF